jgi:hypothetical protein
MKESYIDYINNYDKLNTHKKYIDIFYNLDNNLKNITNFIFYGPSGTSKYSCALKLIEKYSNCNLKYEKKMIINSNKNEHYIKISDIHYEINMENLTCNAKTLFNDIYINIIDAIQVHDKREGIILCKNFHTIDNELLEVFYSYMQKKIIENFTVKFILITESISFINKNILNISKILYFPKLSVSNDKNFLYDNLSSINLLKFLELNKNNTGIIDINCTLCNSIINYILDYNDIKIIELRNKLYDLLTYNLNIYECIYYILNKLIIIKKLDNIFINDIFIKTCIFFKYYNNNYRPIYHLESYILYLISTIKSYEIE